MSINQSWWDRIKELLGGKSSGASGDDYLKPRSQRGGQGQPSPQPTGETTPSAGFGPAPAPPPTNIRPGASPDQMYSAAQAQQQPKSPRDWHDPYSLYYSPDMIVDSKTGQIYDPSGHGKDTIAFRGYGGYAKAHGFPPPNYQLDWPEPPMGRGGGGGGAGGGHPFVFNDPSPSAPTMDRMQSPAPFNMQDPYPAPERGPAPSLPESSAQAPPAYQRPPAPGGFQGAGTPPPSFQRTEFQGGGEPPPVYQRDDERYRKLLGY
jgi:hypothetical protein